jgi:nucleoid DNA-binding protein
VTKADIVERISEGTGLTKVETEAVINGFIHTLKNAMAEGERVDLRGFGTFLVQHRAPRTARNPRTNEPIAVPAAHIPVFKASKEFRRSVDIQFSKE